MRKTHTRQSVVASHHDYTTVSCTLYKEFLTSSQGMYLSMLHPTLAHTLTSVSEHRQVQHPLLLNGVVAITSSEHCDQQSEHLLPPDLPPLCVSLSSSDKILCLFWTPLFYKSVIFVFFFSFQHNCHFRILMKHFFPTNILFIYWISLCLTTPLTIIIKNILVNEINFTIEFNTN